MPIIKSAKKRVKQTKVRTSRNLATKRAVRTEVKAVEMAVAAGKAKDAQAAFVRAQSALDTAVKKNLLHKNKAARKKSQLNTMVKSVAGKSKPATKKPAITKKTPAKTAKKTTKKA